MRPLDAATMQVITTDAVTLLLRLLTGPSTAKPPTAILLIPLCFTPLSRPFLESKQDTTGKDFQVRFSGYFVCKKRQIKGIYITKQNDKRYRLEGRK
ncbi:hypothetical protein SLA2020_058950 [Shorea laevis]